MIDKCKGLFWRYSESQYLSSHNSIEIKKSLRLLKRKSCSGCPECEWVWEFIMDDIGNARSDYLSKLEQGKIYTYQVHYSQGYYDSHPEIDEFEFIKA